MTISALIEGLELIRSRSPDCATYATHEELWAYPGTTEVAAFTVEELKHLGALGFEYGYDDACKCGFCAVVS